MAQVPLKDCDICEESAGKYYCVDCEQLFCQGCKTLHLKAKSCNDHVFQDYDKINTEVKKIKCEEHGQHVVYFCDTCSVLLCNICLPNTHKKHEFYLIDDAAAREKEAVEKDIQEESYHVTKLADKFATVSKQIDEFKASNAKIVQNITKHGEDIKNMVDKITKSHINEVKNDEAVQLEEKNKEQLKIKEAIRQSEGVIKTASSALKDKNNTAFLAAVPEIKSSFEAMQTPDIKSLEKDTKKFALKCFRQNSAQDENETNLRSILGYIENESFIGKNREISFSEEHDIIISKFLKELFHKSSEKDLQQIDSTENMIESLIESYQKAESWQLKRQISSVISISKSFQEVSEILPETIEYRYYVAKKHAITQGRALPPVEKDKSRKKMDPIKLDSFLDYITSSHIIKDLPFGQRKLRTSSGDVIETPKIIRCMAPQAIIDQYKQYCEEKDMEPLGTSNMFKILQNCTATIRKSLEGLDYFLDEGGRSIDDLIDIISALDLTEDESKIFKDVLFGAKRYLKTDYKVHVAENATIADHCGHFALSDNDQSFQTICDHAHDDVCESGEQIQDILESVRKDFETTNFDERSYKDDIKFRLLQAEKGIKS